MQPPEPTWQQAVALWWRDVHSTVWMAARDVRLWAVEARGYWFARMLLRLIRCAYPYRDESLAKLIVKTGRGYLRRSDEVLLPDAEDRQEAGEG